MTIGRVLIVSGQHFVDAPRKVDLHFIAEALLSRGWEVDVLTWRLSFVSRFLNDGRWDYAKTRRLNAWVRSATGADQFIWVSAVHPLNLKKPILNRLTAPFFADFGRFLPKSVVARLPHYSHILIESGPSPLLARKIRAHAPQAFLIYHAADRLAAIDVHPCVIETLTKTIGLYDSIHIMAEAMRADFPADAPVSYLPHGISKAVFDKATRNPYPGARNAVSVGDMLFDPHAIETLARDFTDWTFHLFGKKARLDVSLSNVIAHGEKPFGEIVPFIKFADIGLAPYHDGAGADYLSQSSLKMIQYTYCGLPIVAPSFAAAGRAHVAGYLPGNETSIRNAFLSARDFDRTAIARDGVRDWSETVETLFAPSGGS